MFQGILEFDVHAHAHGPRVVILYGGVALSNGLSVVFSNGISHMSAVFTKGLSLSNGSLLDNSDGHSLELPNGTSLLRSLACNLLPHKGGGRRRPRKRRRGGRGGGSHRAGAGGAGALGRDLRFSICACHPCAGAMLIFSASFPFQRMIPEGNPGALSQDLDFGFAASLAPDDV